MLQFGKMRPTAKEIFSFDYTDQLEVGTGSDPSETIVSATITISVLESCLVNDPDPQQLLLGSDILTNGNKSVSFFLSGGILGCEYLITCLATTTEGQILPAEATLNISIDP